MNTYLANYYVITGLVLILAFFIWRSLIRRQIHQNIRIILDNGKIRLNVPTFKNVYRYLLGSKVYERQRRKTESRLLLLEPLIDDVQETLRNRSDVQALPEPVYFTAYYPRKTPVGKWHLFTCYTHIKSVVPAMRNDIISFIQDIDHQPPALVSQKEAWLKFGSRLTLVPRAKNVVFNPQWTDIWWSEDLNRAHFYFRGKRATKNIAVEGEVLAYVGLVLVARLPITFHFYEGDASPQLTFGDYDMTHCLMYRNIYAAFAQEDSDAINYLLQALVATGDEGLIDSVTRRGQRDWLKHSKQLIQSANSFQLFWSQHSARCPVVRREVDIATHLDDRKPERFITGIYWKTPFPTPPEDLSFADFQYSPVKKNRRHSPGITPEYPQ